MKRIYQDLNNETERHYASIDDRVRKTEQAVQDLQNQVSRLNVAVERVLWSLHCKVESMLRGDASATASGAASFSPSTSSSCQRTQSSHSRGVPLQKAPTSAQEEPNPTTFMDDVSSVSNSRVTSVTEAAAAGDAEALRRILANGGDANQRDANGVPALHLAAARGHVLAVGALLDGGASIDLQGPKRRRALHEATANGHADVVSRLLEDGSVVEVGDEQGMMALKLAIDSKQWLIARLLVEKGADSNARVFDGKSALMVAAAQGEIETVAVMLRQDKPKNKHLPLSYAKNACVVLAFEDCLPGVLSQEGGWAMRHAAANGRLESMVALLDAGVDIDCRDDMQSTALMYASDNGHVDCVEELLRRNAQLDVANKFGNTALHWASWYGHEKVVCVLLDAGADVTKRNILGNTALSYAKTEAMRNIIRKHVGLTKAPTSATEKQNSTISMRHASSLPNHRGSFVMEAAAAGNTVAMCKILANGGDVNQTDSKGVPALHLAAARGHVLAVRALLERGARVGLECPGRRTALHIATANGHVDVVQYLLDTGSKVAVKDSQGNTPLKLAINSKQWQIARLLVEKGADSNATLFEGKSALLLAAAEGDIKNVAVMLQHNKPDDIYRALSYAKDASVVRVFEDAFPGVISQDGGGAMRQAAANGRLESMVALLDEGVDIDCKNTWEWTALMWASFNGHVECVKELLRRRAQLDATDKWGESALHFASMNGNKDVVRVLLIAGADATKRNTEGYTALDLAETDAVKSFIKKYEEGV